MLYAQPHGPIFLSQTKNRNENWLLCADFCSDKKSFRRFFPAIKNWSVCTDFCPIQNWSDVIQQWGLACHCHNTKATIKKAQGYKQLRYGYMHMCLFIAAACDLDFYESILSDSTLKKLQSNPFIENKYLIIVVFSLPHFSIYDILYTKENTQSLNARATHFT